MVSYNNSFLSCKFFGPSTEPECSTTELRAAFGVMTREIIVYALKYATLWPYASQGRAALPVPTPVKERDIE